MDLIKEVLKGKKIQKISVKSDNLVDSKRDELTLSDRLLIENFMIHLNRKKVEKYFKNQSENTIRKLLMVDLYVAEFGDKNLYEFLNEYIHINSWTVFLETSLRGRIDKFIQSIYLKHKLIGKNIQQEIVENVLHQYVNLDFSAYRPYIKTIDQNFVILCDNLLRIEPAFTEIKELKEMIKKKTDYLTDLLNYYNIDIKKKGLNALYLLNSIKELKK